MINWFITRFIAPLIAAELVKIRVEAQEMFKQCLNRFDADLKASIDALPQNPVLQRSITNRITERVEEVLPDYLQEGLRDYDFEGLVQSKIRDNDFDDIIDDYMEKFDFDGIIEEYLASNDIDVDTDKIVEEVINNIKIVSRND